MNGTNATLVLGVGGTSFTATINSADTTLQEVANDINTTTNTNTGLTATVATTGSTEHLVLAANNSGATGTAITIGAITTLALTDLGLRTSTNPVTINAGSDNATFTSNGTTGATLGTAGTASGPTGASVAGTVLTTANSTSAFAGLTNGHLANTDTLALQVNGVDQTVTFGGTENSLAAVAKTITASSAGVNASVVYGGTVQSPTEQLVLTSKLTGSSTGISVLATGTTANLTTANITGFTGATAQTSAGTNGLTGTAGLDATATAPPSKGAIVNILNSDSAFNGVATASLNGNQVVLESKTNGANSSVQALGTLASALGFSATAATAAAAATGADVKTTVQAAGTLGNINQAVISSSSAPTATMAQPTIALTFPSTAEQPSTSRSPAA